MKNAVLWDVAPCRSCVPPKRFTQVLHGSTSKKTTTFFIFKFVFLSISSWWMMNDVSCRWASPCHWLETYTGLYCHEWMFHPLSIVGCRETIHYCWAPSLVCSHIWISADSYEYFCPKDRERGSDKYGCQLSSSCGQSIVSGMLLCLFSVIVLVLVQLRHCQCRWGTAPSLGHYA
jgi:hypothetical protein